MDKRTFYPYLDNFDELTIIVPFKHYRDNNTYRLIGNDEVIDLVIQQKMNLGSEVKLVCSFDAYIDLGKKYCVENEEEERSELYTGKIVRTELFDNIYRYKKNDLGVTYTSSSSKFKIWTPVAKTVKLELTSPNGSTQIHDMLYTNSGVWRLLLEGDFERYMYRYLVYVNGKEQTVTDPYAMASAPNATHSVIVDWSKTYVMKEERPFVGEMQDAIIYETSVRDFSMDPNVPFQHRGKFLGLIEGGLKTPGGNPAGLDHMKRLGITHVQLMPFFDFDGIDELVEDGRYNWGYNPRQYNVPQGWFATDPQDPYNRINELKQTIDTLHKEGIGVIMDVVYNHVADPFHFPIEKLVPGYLYHVDREGIYTNVSGCKNDLATHRKMVRKFIIDSVLFWTNEYKMDGFRFDLMGLIDFETMNEIRQELHSISNSIIVYGEGWKMHQTNMADRMAHMRNKNVLHTIGFFNDTFRETIKGATFKPENPGYAFGINEHPEIVMEILLGSAHNRYLFKYASQSINYVECHDNHTFFDKGLHITKDLEVIRKAQKLATSMVILAEGVPFLHSGQEFYRTKQGVENSFESPDAINTIDWTLIDQHNKDIEDLATLIAFRKEHHSLRMRTQSDLSQYAEVLVLPTDSTMVHLTNGTQILLFFKPTTDEETFVVPNDYELVYSSCSKCQSEDNQTFTFHDAGTYIFVQRM